MTGQKKVTEYKQTRGGKTIIITIVEDVIKGLLPGPTNTRPGRPGRTSEPTDTADTGDETMDYDNEQGYGDRPNADADGGVKIIVCGCIIPIIVGLIIFLVLYFGPLWWGK